MGTPNYYKHVTVPIRDMHNFDPVRYQASMFDIPLKED